MRDSSLRSPWRRAAVAGVAAAGLATASLTGVAQAEEGQAAPLPVTITGPDKVDLALDGAEDEPGEPQIYLGLTGPGEYDPDSGKDPEPVPNDGYTVTIDATALKGFADVELPRSCEAEGLTAVCHESSLYPGDVYNPSWSVRLDLKDTAGAGDFGKIKVTGEGAGLEFNEHTVDVLVGGPELLKKKLPAEPEGFAAGDTYNAPLGFRNVGSMSADGVVLRFGGSRGLSFPDTYDNCSYAEENKDDLIRYQKVALCTFEGEFLPGTSYELSEPVKVKTAGFALNDVFHYGFDAVGAKETGALRAGAAYRQGTGERLTLKPVDGGGSGDYAKYAEIDLPTRNTFDLDLTGARVAGEQGETVKVDIALSNHGPAWIGALRSGGEPLSFTVQIPEGASVVDSPSLCQPVNDATPSEYVCFADTPFLEDDRRTYGFQLRIDEVVEGAKGEIALPEYENPREGDPSNDAGWIVLNGTGDEETPGDTGGATGGTGTTGGSDTTGGTGTSGGSGGAGSDGGTSTGATGSTGSTGGSDGGEAPQGDRDDDGGLLASTGSTALFASAGAALALAAGGVLFAVSRRRRSEGAA
ncbi:hypothetical protein ACFUVV_23755 [Streptomyces sp. NPDC057376]|uniref:hypothetical protein n=1 Tax=unclassified Streptomyces TaxID=2593676 RepID=UPI00093F1EB7|nr:hypothetical protein [Streptomyces sp. CB02414]OKI84728.1 hypothetical protein AMK11_20290 [Streptomyces sp. CB02414]